jgi:hypothetical protein
MATITGTITRVGEGRDAWQVRWASMGNADTGTVIEMPQMSDRSVQIDGTFASATVVMEGSNDGTNFFTLTDGQGNAISKTTASLEQIAEFTRYLRASTSGGAGSTLNVTVFGRGQRS